MKHSLPLVLSIVPVVCMAMDAKSFTQATNTVLEHVLGASHDSSLFMQTEVERHGWTPSDCAEILRTSAQSLAGSTDLFDLQRRENAIGMLGKFGGVDALPELIRLVETEHDTTQYFAAFSLIEASKADPEAMASVARVMSRPSTQSPPFSFYVITLVNDILTDGGPVKTYQENLLRILLNRVSNETRDCSRLDEILCREVPKWRASPQRAANAAKMIREHPDDARLVSFFENVRSNALASAQAALSTNQFASATASPTNNVPAGGLSSKGSGDVPPADPWADLLDDLPEKKRWTPPEGRERPN